MMKRQQGFSIVSAIFLLVVLAFLGTAMVTFSTNQQQSAAMDVLGSRAYQAARAGIEWGAYQTLIGGTCPTATLPAGTLAGTLNGFSVAVSCATTVHSEVRATGGTVNVYNLSSIATQGTVERQVQMTIAQ
jgi:MSHA biogenesis protein MshP